jgi:hypothetical protein
MKQIRLLMKPTTVKINRNNQLHSKLRFRLRLRLIQQKIRKKRSALAPVAVPAVSKPVRKTCKNPG